MSHEKVTPWSERPTQLNSTGSETVPNWTQLFEVRRSQLSWVGRSDHCLKLQCRSATLMASAPPDSQLQCVMRVHVIDVGDDVRRRRQKKTWNTTATDDEQWFSSCTFEYSRCPTSAALARTTSHSRLYCCAVVRCPIIGLTFSRPARNVLLMQT